MLSFWDFGGDGGRDCRLKGGGQAQTLSYIENAFLLGNSEEHIFLLGFWGDGGRDCRLKGGGQAQTLNMKKMLSFYEFMKEMLSFWKVILPKMRFRPTQTLKMKNMLSFCEFMKEMLSFWSGLGKHAGRERLQI